jgi:hypothetical protein
MIDECELKFKGYDIVIETMDPSRIALFCVKFKDILEKPIHHKFAVVLSDIHAILSTMDYDTVDLEFSYKLLKFKQGSETFTLKGMESYEGESIPLSNLIKIIYDKKFSFEQGALKDICKKALLYSEILRIAYDDEGTEFKSEGVQGSYTRTEGLIKEKGASSYSLIWLKILLEKTSKLFTEPFTLEMRTDHPLHIIYDTSVLRYDEWLAPRVEEPDWEDDD